MTESGSELKGYLEDIDIEIQIRSGSTDLSILQKLMKVILTSSTSLEDIKIVTTETEMKVKFSSSGKLTVLTQKLRIE